MVLLHPVRIAWLGKDDTMKKLGMLLVLFGLVGIFGCAQDTKPAAAPAAAKPADTAKPDAAKPDAAKAPPAPEAKK
jgi:hypothetical protein